MRSVETELARLAMRAGDRLRRRGIRAVLTGGTCAHIRSGGAYTSRDVDFVLEALPTQAELDDALGEIGFQRVGDQYVHPAMETVIEFPSGPLAIGTDHAIRPVLLRRGSLATLALSPTDSCRDRLAAFYHWSDRQALAAAVAIAFTHRVHMNVIREWSRIEQAQDQFEEFVNELNRRRTSRRHR